MDHHDSILWFLHLLCSIQAFVKPLRLLLSVRPQEQQKSTLDPNVHQRKGMGPPSNHDIIKPNGAPQGNNEWLWISTVHSFRILTYKCTLYYMNCITAILWTYIQLDFDYIGTSYPHQDLLVFITLSRAPDSPAGGDVEAFPADIRRTWAAGQVPWENQGQVTWPTIELHVSMQMPPKLKGFLPAILIIFNVWLLFVLHFPKLT